MMIKLNLMIMSLAQQNRFLNPASGGTIGMTRQKLSFRIRRLTDEKS